VNVSNRTGVRVAYAAAAANLLAALGMLLVLRPGLPAGDPVLGRRVLYVLSHLAAWRAGWLVWHLAALLLLALFVVLFLRWKEAAPLAAPLALICAAAGLAADVSAEGMFMVPAVGSGTAHLEGLAVLLTGYVGNGLYTVAGILLTWAGRRDLPALLLYVAVPVWVAGLWLAAATLGGSTTGQVLSTSVLMPMFVLWAFLVGRWLSASES